MVTLSQIELSENNIIYGTFVVITLTDFGQGLTDVDFSWFGHIYWRNP